MAMVGLRAQWPCCFQPRALAHRMAAVGAASMAAAAVVERQPHPAVSLAVLPPGFFLYIFMCFVILATLLQSKAMALWAGEG